MEEYIEQKLKEGYTEQEVINAAKKAGWDEKLVKGYLKDIKENK